MIIDFSVENFGSIKNKQTLSFEASSSTELEQYYVFTPYERTERKEKLRLLKLGIIYGPNASGKSTILKALDFLQFFISQSAYNKNETLSFDPFLFDLETPNQPSKIALRYIHSGIRFDYEVAFNNKAILNESLYFSDPNRALVFDRTTDLDKELSIIKFGDKVKISKIDQAVLTGNTLWNNTVLTGFNKSNIKSELLKIATDWFEKILHRSITPNIHVFYNTIERMQKGLIDKTTVTELMKKADFRVDDLVFNKVPHDEARLIYIANLKNHSPHNKTLIDELENQAELMFQHRVGDQVYELAPDKESDGTRRYFEFAGLVAQLVANPSVLPIDEFESSLHPDLIKHFLLMYLESVKESQLLLTTHYRELLQERDILRDDAIWFTDKGDDAATVLYSLADFSTDTIRKTSSAYNAYKIGKLGAVPNL